MADDRLSLPDETDSQSGAMLPVNTLPHGNGEWNGIAVQDTPAALPGPDLMIYVHAVRRHWLMALGIGLLCAGIAGPLVWWAVGTRYTAQSHLQLSIQEPSLISSHDVNTMDRERFEIYKMTQQRLLLARNVLQAALRKPTVKDIPVIQHETQYGDAVNWLEKNLSISFPGKAEVMSVSLTRDDPDDAKALVKAVVDAYMTVVVNADNERKRRRFTDLETICGDEEQKMRTRREELRKLVADAGGLEPELLATRVRLILDELAVYRGEAAKIMFEINKAKGELAAQEALLKNVDQADVPQVELDLLVQNDPVARQLGIELAWKKMDAVYTGKALKPGVNSGYAKRFDDEVSMLQQQYDARQKEMEIKARAKKRSVIQTEILRLTAPLASLEKQQGDMMKDITRMKEDAKNIGLTSVDIQMLEADLKRMEVVATQLTNEREKLRVEIKATPRITVFEPAEKPLIPSNTALRIVLLCATVLASMCCPAVAVAFWDTRVRRINTAADVSQGLRLPVIGSMPLVPARVIRQLGSPSPRHRVWHLRLTESIDGIAARLLHKADTEQCRVIMVSSAAGGEGKTTLATQLALSLARTGRRTVLVDFDLRRPAFDEMFGVSLSPGVSESLRHESGVGDLMHPNVADNLAVVTAGQWDRQALASLSNGGAKSLFKQLREDFDFVVVDTSPILPVADARFVSQFVDTVVLSVFRDVSEASKIQAACDILTAFGVHSIEAVVTGPSSNLYGRHTGYESTVSA